MSDTPRTDAVVVKLPKETDKYITQNDSWVSADHARQLERELNEAKEIAGKTRIELWQERDQLRTELASLKDSYECACKTEQLHMKELALAVKCVEVLRYATNNGHWWEDEARNALTAYDQFKEKSK